MVRCGLIALIAALAGMLMLSRNYYSYSSPAHMIETNEHVIIESTQFPSSPPVAQLVDAEHAQCLKMQIESLRPAYFPWTWTCPIAQEEEILVETKLYAYEDNGTALLDQPAWGQLCNRMGILSGALLRAKSEGHGMLALNPIWSELVWHLDLHAVSNAMRGGGGGLLLDCMECANTNQVRCNNLLLPGGNLYSVKRMFFTVRARYETSLLYSRYRPRNRGFSPYIAENLIPKRFLIDQIIAQMQQFANGGQAKLFGIHRRTMDRQCARYASSRTEYNCLVTESLYREADAIATALTSQQQYSTEEVELAHPMFMACNYTLNTPAQVEEIVSRFTTLAREKINLLLATDGMDPAGDIALAKANVVNNTYKLDLQCFQQHKFQVMLAEMIALSLATVHVDNPLSSCGNLVAHWRVKLFPQANYTSFPNVCYDYFYNQEVHPL